MERISGFMRSHYMLPSGVCSRRIGPADAMVIAVAVVSKHTQNTTFSLHLSYFLPSDLVFEASAKKAQNGPSTHVIEDTSFV